ncbi:hypothetical protein PM8797T_21988 [Gimesia maris DSM 8797]|nr:hypothetical protein PM8797T_21988 [Gimesia maris DSM 8797]
MAFNLLDRAGEMVPVFDQESE